MTINAGYAKTVKANGTTVKGATGGLTRSRAMGSTNIFGIDHQKRIALLKDFPGNVSGPYDPADPGVVILEAAVASGADVTMQYLYDGTNGFEIAQKVESFEFTGEVEGVQQYSCTMVSNGDITAVP